MGLPGPVQFDVKSTKNTTLVLTTQDGKKYDIEMALVVVQVSDSGITNPLDRKPIFNGLRGSEINHGSVQELRRRSLRSSETPGYRSMKLDLSASAIEARLREASRLAGSLHPDRRLDTKIDLRGAAVAARLKEASDLSDLCRALARAGAERFLRRSS